MIEHALHYSQLGWHIFPVWGIKDGKCACAAAATCKSPGKHPVTWHGLTEATTDEKQIKRWWTDTPDASIGVVMAPSGLLALDVDLYHNDLQKIEALQKLHGELPETVVQKSGSGDGYHFLFQAPDHPVCGVLGGVVVRSKAYIIVAPSTHISGGQYVWEHAPGDVEIAALPPAWCEALKKTATVGAVGVPAEDTEPAWLQAISQEERLAAMRSHLEAETGEIKGTTVAGTTFNVTRTAVRGFAIRDPEAALAAMVEIYDAKCVPPWEERMGRHVYNAYERAHSPEWGEKLAWQRPIDEQLSELGITEETPITPARVTGYGELMSHLESARDKLKRASNPKKKREGKLLGRALKGLSLTEHADDDRIEALKIVLKTLAREAPSTASSELIASVLTKSVVVDPGKLVEMVAAYRTKIIPKDVKAAGALPEPADDDELRAQLEYGREEGSIKTCPQNIERILHYAKDLRGFVRFNELTKEVEITDGPFDNIQKGVLDIAIMNWLGEQWKLTASKEAVGDQLAFISRTIGAYNPVAEYLKGLTWDGIPRLDGWLIDYCGAADTTYNRRVAAMWMISACARGTDPGCKVDSVLVLEGAQGARKSTAFAVLGGDWFSGTPLDLSSKDAYQITSSTWIIELAELSSLRAGEIETHKAFLTAASDKFRPPYGRVPDTFKRFCVFGGTTNESEYLQDSTGNRRYWACRVTTIDIARLREDRDQLWAEAMYRYLSAEIYPDRAHPDAPGERWWLTAEEEAEAATVIAGRRAEDPWVGLIQEWVANQMMPGPGVTPPKTRFTLAEIAKHALELNNTDLHRFQKMIARSMRSAGFECLAADPSSDMQQRYWVKRGTVVHDTQGDAEKPQDPVVTPPERPGTN